MATRKKAPREIRVTLECGHIGHISTGRYRVSKDLCAMLVGDYVRKGMWCLTCSATCQPVTNLGVFQES